MRLLFLSKKDRILKAIFDYHVSSKPNEQPDLFVRFWQKSYNHFNIIMLLGSVTTDHSGYAYEEICEMYPNKHASRTTILSILNEGVKNNFFLKNINPNDHRKQNYKLNADRKKDVVAWLDNHPIRNL